MTRSQHVSKCIGITISYRKKTTVLKPIEIKNRSIESPKELISTAGSNIVIYSFAYAAVILSNPKEMSKESIQKKLILMGMNMHIIRNIAL